MKIDGFTFRKNLDPFLMNLFKKINPQMKPELLQEGWDVMHEQLHRPHLFNSLHKASSCYIEIDVPVQSILNTYSTEFSDEEMQSFDSSNSDKFKQPNSQNQQYFKVKITKALEEVWLDERRRRQNQKIAEPLVGIIDYTQNLEGNKDVINRKKDPLWINFINKGKSRDGTGKIIDDVITMIKSSANGKFPQPKLRMEPSRNIIENYNGIIFQER